MRVRPALLALSASGLLAIAGYEGFSSTAYKDTGGVLTVGFGHTGAEVKPGARVSVFQALQVLGRDVGKTEKALQSCLGEDVRLTQGEWDAYAALAYNVGAGAVCRSSIKPKLRAGQYQAACEAIRSFNTVKVRERQPDGTVVVRRVVSKGLTNRRNSEYQKCVQGIKDEQISP